jgi:hypothetical protein
MAENQIVTQLKSLSVAVNPLAIIDRIIAELELTRTQYGDAVKSYEAVAANLQKIHPLWRISIFPQGSMRLGTTVRPIQGERFDLDMVCWLALSGKLYTPEQVFNFVWDALGQDETYRQMRSKKNRCIRLEYAEGRKFYLDITPAIPDWAKTESLYVPDREHRIWCSSHPIGFCDDWFKKIAEILPVIRPLILNKRSSAVVMANAATVEQMPEYGEFEKTPLQRIVQMFKRDRDEYFQTDPVHRPSSILLTTIIANSYSSLVAQPVGDLLEFVVKVVAKLPEYIDVVYAPGSRKFSVPNPVNPEENFAESWTEEHHRRFLIWHKRFAAVLQKVHQSKGLGFGADEMLKNLAETFGKDRVTRAAKALGADTNALHDTGKLRSIGGTLGTVGSAVPKTIYFGGEK